MARDTELKYGIFNHADWEECYVTDRAFKDLLEVGAIKEGGSLRPDTELSKIDPWRLIMAACGQLHG